MSYITCRFGAQPTSSLVPATPKPKPAMTWAEMARAEGHRPAMPPRPAGKPHPEAVYVPPAPPQTPPSVREMLTRLAEHGPLPRCKLPRRAMDRLPELIAEGLVRERLSPVPHNPHRKVLSITPAGRARLEETA